MELVEENPLERLQSMVKDFPHSLQLKELTLVKTQRCKAILDRIQSERGQPWELEEDGIRGDNFLTILNFRLCHKESAFRMNVSVLERCPTNITALVNKAYMKMVTGHEKESMDTINELQKLKNHGDFKILLATSVAEEAYSLSRIHPKFYLRSIDLYETAILQFPKKYLWKFGCALTCGRSIKLSKSVDNLTVERVKTLCKLAINYLHDVANYAGNGNLKPRAWVELGELYSYLKSPVYPLTHQIVDDIKGSIITVDAEVCFDRALQMEGVQDDDFVLQRCGKFLRFSRSGQPYEETLQECYKLLYMAYKLRPTSFACDTLATVLLKMLENKIEPNGDHIDLAQEYGPGKREWGHRDQVQRQDYRRNSHGNFRGRGRKYHTYDRRPNYAHANESQPCFVVPVVPLSGRTRGHNRGPWGARRQLRFTEQVRASSSFNPCAKEFVSQRMVSMESADAEGAVGGIAEFPESKSGQNDPSYSRVTPKGTNTDGLTSSIEAMTLSSTPQRQSSKEKFKKSLGSPKEVPIYPSDNPLLRKAVDFLRESITRTLECNKSAMYTLGMMYRRLGKPDEAVEQFRQVFSDLDSSLYNKVNAYEQTGFCLLDMSEDKNLSDDQRQHRRDESKHMMRMAIKYAAKLVARTPAMAREDLDTWQAYPTLRQILHTEKTGDSLKDIAHLCDLIGKHRESLKFYEELRKVDPKDTDVLSKMIKTYMLLKDFHNAQTFLNILLCTSDGRKMMEKNANLVYQVYLGTVRHLVMSGLFEEKNLIRNSCRSAFEHKHGGISGEDEQNWDVFILDDPKQTDVEATALQSWLKDTCGLSVTRNDDEVPGGELTLYAEVDLITHSKCLMVVVGSVDTKRQKTLVTIALNADCSKLIVPVLTCFRKLPVMLTGRSPVMASKNNHRDPQMLLHCLLSLLDIEHEQFEWLK